MRNRDELIQAIEQGAAVEYLHFWGPHPAPDGSITKSCLSQWYDAPFEKNGVGYATAEHFMMAGKAALFGDQDAFDAIVKAPHPKTAKSLGRKVRDFRDDVWVANRWSIVVEGNLLKFSQHEALGAFLVATADAVIVEASPRDQVWGIGLSAGNRAAHDPKRWRGQNLLGFVLMEVRATLRSRAEKTIEIRSPVE